MTKSLELEAVGSDEVPEAGGYLPPEFLWEQAFVALAQASPPIGCEPGDPPPCPEG